MATGKPTSRASEECAASRKSLLTKATAVPASGPNSGPTTIAPTMVTGESVATPTTASRQAMVMNARYEGVSVDASPVCATSSSHTTASEGLPGAASTASSATSDSTVSICSRPVPPLCVMPRSVRPSSTTSADSRASMHSTRSPAGSTAAPRCTVTSVAPGSACSTASAASVVSAGQITRTCSTHTPL